MLREQKMLERLQQGGGPQQNGLEGSDPDATEPRESFLPDPLDGKIYLKPGRFHQQWAHHLLKNDQKMFACYTVVITFELHVCGVGKSGIKISSRYKGTNTAAAVAMTNTTSKTL